MCEDEELIREAIAGDRDALSLLLERYGEAVSRPLRFTIAPRWRSSVDVDDVMQVTYLEAFLEIERLIEPSVSAFRGWLTRIASNNLRDAIRGLQAGKRARQLGGLGVGGGEKSMLELVERVNVDGSTPSGVFARAERVALLTRAMQELPRDYANVLRLFDLQRMTVEDTARHLGKSVGAVHMLRARALVRLRDLLGSGSKFFSDIS